MSDSWEAQCGRADLVGDAAVDAVEAHVHEERLARLHSVLALGGRRGFALGRGRQQRLFVALLRGSRLRARPLRQPPQRQRLVALQEMSKLGYHLLDS